MDNKNANRNNSKVVLPSDFHKIKFGEADFENIQSQVKFIAGNSECDVLTDVKERYTIIPGDVPQFVFIQDNDKNSKWKKTITFEKNVPFVSIS